MVSNYLDKKCFVQFHNLDIDVILARVCFHHLWRLSRAKLVYVTSQHNDVSQFGMFHTLVVLAGTWAEFILPLLIVVGLLTRLSALGMIGFVVVQTLTDLYGHGGIAHAETLGAWFDRIPDAIVFDQRSLWIFLLLVIVMRGPGPFSLDRILGIEAREEE